MKILNDLETYQRYLEKMTAEVENLAAGFFGPGSMVWRVNRRGVKGLAAFQTVLIHNAQAQAYQKSVSCGRILEHPYERIIRTFQMQQLILFGNCREAVGALINLYDLDSKVTGPVRFESRFVGCAAIHPVLLIWIYGTLMDDLIRSHDLFASPLAFEDRKCLYQESKLFARLLGIPGESLPLDLLEFYDWISETLAGEEVRAAPPAREIAEALLRMPAPVFWPVNYILGVGLVPERLRAEYGLIWNSNLALLFNTGVEMIRQVASRLPVRIYSFGGLRQPENG